MTVVIIFLPETTLSQIQTFTSSPSGCITAFNQLNSLNLNAILTKQMSQYTLFVYGTLKKGFANHHLLREAEYLGKAKTKNKYALYAAGIPYVIKDQTVSYIHGELYQINARQLERIDRLEGHPEWYYREQVEVVDKHKQIVMAWLYFFPDRIGELRLSGRYQH